MAQTKAGALKAAAIRTGLTVAEYEQRVSGSEKWCYRCKRWHPTENFHADHSRFDSLSSVCRTCKNVRVAPGPSKPVRAAKRTEQLAWCSKCESWLPLDEVSQGKCRTHRNEDARQRYSESLTHREARKAKTRLRKSLVDPIPEEAKETLLEDADGKCGYCGAVADTFDHIIPISKGGTTTPGNVIPCCLACNSSKKDRNMDEWISGKGLPGSETLEDRLILADAGFYG